MHYKTRHRACHHTSDTSDTTPLIKEAIQREVQTSYQGACGNHQKHTMTSGNAAGPQTMIRLRFSHKISTPEAWWVPCQTEGPKTGRMNRDTGNSRYMKENIKQECDRLGWMSRLRPKPHRQKFIQEKGGPNAH
ncbi:hypothetical protein POX_f07375 [Penicillium oxalicum]|uniref:hypothetical protein n=1 Tax=Penicillium oxalicum TaxID=69781 RepID=UPI0020B6B918|nr:hypothetical protein POX_f07375 [Penicillium oxalicum]KAI2787022.1 hypothetical protein POX_f07375 [Penicillium oxalicum]